MATETLYSAAYAEAALTTAKAIFGPEDPRTERVIAFWEEQVRLAKEREAIRG